MKPHAIFTLTASSAVALLLALPAIADQVINDDQIVVGSLCVGLDCSNGENFSFDTIRMKENNVRLQFLDTSNSSSFPQNDWRIVANDTTNGGANYLAIEDSTAGRIPFRVEAGANANTLVVESDGDIGIKTLNPVVDIHVVEGNTPTLRLEQDGSDGFTPQTWDLAGNEANFFLRDVTNGSKLIFRVEPDAPDSSIFIENSGRVGMGLSSPQYAMHLRRSDGSAAIFVEEVSSVEAAREMFRIINNGRVFFGLEDTSIADDGVSGRLWNTQNDEGAYTITTAPGGADGKEFTLDVDGNLTITGNFISGSQTLTVPDYVFAPGYDLRPLAEVRAFIEAESHLPDVPSAAEIAETGLNVGHMQMKLLKKIEELTLYTLEQEDRISALSAEVEALRSGAE